MATTPSQFRAEKCVCVGGRGSEGNIKGGRKGGGEREEGKRR